MKKIKLIILVVFLLISGCTKEKVVEEENYVEVEKTTLVEETKVEKVEEKDVSTEKTSTEIKEIKTLDFLKPSILKLNLPDNTVIDGEICSIRDGQESFSSIVSYIHKGIKK